MKKEDEEGAAATSPIFCVARNRDRETAQVFAFQELLARTVCKLQKGNFTDSSFSPVAGDVKFSSRKISLCLIIGKQVSGSSRVSMHSFRKSSKFAFSNCAEILVVAVVYVWWIFSSSGTKLICNSAFVLRAMVSFFRCREEDEINILVLVRLIFQ